MDRNIIYLSYTKIYFLIMKINNKFILKNNINKFITHKEPQLTKPLIFSLKRIPIISF